MKQWLPRHWISDNERQWSLGWRKGCLSCCLERKFPDHRRGQGAQSRREGAGSQEAPWPRAESQGGKIKRRDCQRSHSLRQAQVCTWVWAKYRGREGTIPQLTWEGEGLAKIILLPTSRVESLIIHRILVMHPNATVVDQNKSQTSVWFHITKI